MAQLNSKILCSLQLSCSMFFRQGVVIPILFHMFGEKQKFFFANLALKIKSAKIVLNRTLCRWNERLWQLIDPGFRIASSLILESSPFYGLQNRYANDLFSFFFYAYNLSNPTVQIVFVEIILDILEAHNSDSEVCFSLT